MPLRVITPAQFLNSAQQIASRFPDAELIKNHVGNLTVIDDNEYVAWLDLRTGEIHDVDEIR